MIDTNPQFSTNVTTNLNIEYYENCYFVKNGYINKYKSMSMFLILKGETRMTFISHINTKLDDHAIKKLCVCVHSVLDTIGTNSRLIS